MFSVSFTGVLGGFESTSLGQVTDLEVFEWGETTLLYATYASTRSISAFTITDDQLAMGLDTLDLGSDPGLSGSVDIDYVEIDGQQQLWVAGNSDGTVGQISLATDGSLNTAQHLSLLPTDSTYAPILSETIMIDGQQFTLSAPRGQVSLNIARLDSTDGVIQVAALQYQSSGSTSDEITALATFKVGSENIALIGVSGSNAIASYSITADGSPSFVNEIGNVTGLGIGAPTEIALIHTVNGVIALVASSQSSSLTSVLIRETGELAALDHVTDSLDTRFSDISALTTVDVDGRHFVFVAGTDDGITMLELLPNGQIIHHETIAQSDTVPIENITSLSASMVGNDIQLFAATSASADIAQFEINLTNMGIVSANSSDNPGITGTGGDDILIATDFNSVLTGAAGADSFIFDAALGSAGNLGTITDYEAGLDKIAFPNFVMLRNQDQLQIIELSDGAEIHYGDAYVTVYSQDGQPLSSGQLINGVFDLQHHFVGDAPDILFDEGDIGPLIHMGTDAGETITGGDYGDDLNGLGGGDVINGMAGDDIILGGFGDDQLIGGAGSDVLTGSAQSDIITGGSGNDFINGGFGHDQLSGGAGADKFYHEGILDHGSDWIMDYNAHDGDILLFGDIAAQPDDFQVNFGATDGNSIQEAFVIHTPTGQIMWALLDGAQENQINLSIAGGEAFDLLG